MNKIINNDPYGQVICRWFNQSFPKLAPISKQSTLEIISSLMIGTKENRLGPIPPPEHLVVIRETIRKSIELGLPIPVLVPWGGRKTNPNLSVDMAEVSALMQLITLDDAVRQYHAPGLLINIRVEDLGADWLYTDTYLDYMEGAFGVEKYCYDFTSLTEVLCADKNIKAISENDLMPARAYYDLSLSYTELIYDTLSILNSQKGVDIESIKSYQQLVNLGWKGTFPEEQQEYYYSRYRALYPGKSEDSYRKMLAKYLGGAKARYDLNGRGEPKTDGTFIQITFVPPVPGAPTGMFNNTLYWRTCPASQSRTHIAPWRAKGYLKISDDEVQVKIANFGEEIISELYSSETTIQRSPVESVVIKTDYLLLDGTTK